ncbi:MAG: hypothetical protein GTO63_13580, partial [Anaerolineae bacterium]|nr:hypothetical protein [Anaerolineae bacterium]NIN95881.1 hypothetical protein [Anaerolineae bacterium]NIQ78853.1 hypothetical protein [Anaerolineae bacterium]
MHAFLASESVKASQATKIYERIMAKQELAAQTAVQKQYGDFLKQELVAIDIETSTLLPEEGVGLGRPGVREAYRQYQTEVASGLHPEESPLARWRRIRGTPVDKPVRVLSLGMVKWDPDTNKVRVWHEFFNPDLVREQSGNILTKYVHWDEEAQLVHGLTKKELIEKARFQHYADEINKFIGGARIVGHNLEDFDAPVLADEFRRAGKQLKHGGIIDTLKLARLHYPQEDRALSYYSNSLDKLTEAWGINLRQHHHAQADA